VQVWQYGKTQDTAQSLSSNGSSALASSSTTLSLNGSTFNYTFPAYSMTVLDVKPQTAQTLTSIAVSLVSSNLATTGTEQFSATARDQNGDPMASQPAFTWSVVGNGSIDGTGRFTPEYVSGSATIRATNGSVIGSTTVVLPGPAYWSASTAGSWNASANWQSSSLGGNLAAPGGRGVGGDTVVFQSASGTTANLDGANPALAGITFNNSTNSYTIARGTGGSLQLGAGTSLGIVQVAGGNHAITAPLALLSNLAIDTTSGSSLTINGFISGAARSLTKTGPGALTLSGANSISVINVSGGSLVVRYGASIHATLVIGGGSTVTVAASDPNGNPLDGSADSAPATSGAAVIGSAAVGPAFVDSASVGLAVVGQTPLAQPVVSRADDDAVSTPGITASASGSGSTLDAPQASANSVASVNLNQISTAPPPQEFWAGSLDTVPAPDNGNPPSTEAHAILDTLLAQRESWLE
jgi:autotransporter-associated beta strand protein